jgi:transposase InsO family protein
LPGTSGLWDYHAQPDRCHARLQVITLYDQGWENISMHRLLHVSRPTIDAWIRRFETEHVAGLADRSRAPSAPVRKIWLPLMVQVYHLQKVHPDAGACRIWSLLTRADVSVRTVGRVMALNRLVYDDIPHVPKRGVNPAPGPHPDTAQARHQYWFIDGRRLDVALDGVHWWSLIILAGYSRPMLAGMIAPTEATWVALMVLSTACLRYGAPASRVSDRGGAYTSADVDAVCARLQLRHETISSTQGESDQHWMEAPCNSQRRLYDYQFSLARTPAELERRHQAFMPLYNTTAHQGLLTDRRLPPMPIEVLGAAQGRLYAPDELARQFSHALFPRTTNRHGCVTLHRDHCSVEEGLPHTQGLLWVAGTQVRAMCEGVVLAEYHCRDDWRDRRVTAIGAGVFHPTRVASPQGQLIPLTPAGSVVVYRPRAPGRQAAPGSSTPQLLLFEVVQTG